MPVIFTHQKICQSSTTFLDSIEKLLLPSKTAKANTTKREQGCDKEARPPPPRIALCGDSGGTPRRHPPVRPGRLRRPPLPPAAVRAAAAARGRAKVDSARVAPTSSPLFPASFLLPHFNLAVPRRRRSPGPDPASFSPDPGPPWPDPGVPPSPAWGRGGRRRRRLGWAPPPPLGPDPAPSPDPGLPWPVPGAPPPPARGPPSIRVDSLRAAAFGVLAAPPPPRVAGDPWPRRRRRLGRLGAP